MSNWDDDDFLGGDDSTAAPVNTGGSWDDDDFMGGGSNAVPATVDSWDAADDWETEDKPKKPTGPSKKTLKQIAKEKEEQEKAEKLKKQKQIQEEQKKLENDPEFRAMKRDEERRAQEKSQLDSIGDLFGDDVSAPVSRDVFRKEANPERARELAAMTGLGDGAGITNFDDQNNNDWDQPTVATRAGAVAGSLDSMAFATDADAIAFAKAVAAKIKGVGNAKTTNNSQTVSKAFLTELIRAIGPDMKSQDVDEVLRVTTVVKNDLTKKTQNVKKGKNKKQINLHDNGRHYSDEEDFM